MSTIDHQPSQHRSTQILRAAREVFLTDGWDHFGIERIAEFMECSRPLVYKHFSCKEEILLALAIESKRRRIQLYERAVTFRGRARERMMAIGEVERFLAPRDLPIELFVASTRLRAKTSTARQEELRMLDVRTIGLGAGVIREAISAGDLALKRGLNPEDLQFFLWASPWGAVNILRSDTPLASAGILQPERAVTIALAYTLDGFGWRPLSTDWDYGESRNRMLREVCPPDVVDEIMNA